MNPAPISFECSPTAANEAAHAAHKAAHKAARDALTTPNGLKAQGNGPRRNAWGFFMPGFAVRQCAPCLLPPIVRLCVARFAR